MAWKPVDCHAHSTLSDGALDVPQLIERVTGRGVRPSVSDHISRDVAGAVASIDAIRAYLEEGSPAKLTAIDMTPIRGFIQKEVAENCPK